MRTQERSKQDVTYRPLAGVADGIYQWGEGVPMRATIQPASGAILAQQYGERLQKMKLMLYDGSRVLNQGAGVCVDVAGSQPCDYRIIDAQPWLGHQRAVLELIPPGRSE